MSFSVPMALFDFVPVILYLVAVIILQRDLYNKMSKGAFALFSCGSIFMFVAGFLKALYKLLYAANICDFQRLNQMYFPTASISFLLAGLGLLAMLCFEQGEGKAYSVVAPAAFSGTFIFIIMMVLGVGIMDGCLAVIAKKLNKKVASVLFIVSFVFSLAMGYLGTKDFSQSYMNWVGEAVNTIAMLSLLVGTLMMHKAGLKDAQL